MRIKRKVFIYSGGGYSGCIWEWNICLWDEHGDFHNILTTGFDGIKDEDDAIATVKVFKEMRRGGSNDHPSTLSSRISRESVFLDYSKKKDCGEIMDFNASLVEGLIRSIDGLGEKHGIIIKCHICGRTGQDIEDFEADEPASMGTRMWNTSFKCTTCADEHRCIECGEDFRGCDEMLVPDPERGPICHQCYERKIERLRVLGTSMIKGGGDEVIRIIKEINEMNVLLERHGWDNGMYDPEDCAKPEPEPEENLLLHDTTPYLPMFAQGT